VSRIAVPLREPAIPLPPDHTVPVVVSGARAPAPGPIPLP